MKLYYSPTSPYVRKVLVVAHELGLSSDIELLDPGKNIFEGINPVTALGKVPSLELDSGEILYDSVVICEYLDSLSGKAAIFPQVDPDVDVSRWTVLVLHALANGMTDAQHDRRINIAMPQGEGSPSWDARNQLCIRNCLDEFEQEAELFYARLDIGVIAVACALGFQDLRFPQENWRADHPALTVWYEQFSQRPSMLATRPPA
jgi:glutathione S-transferase